MLKILLNLVNTWMIFKGLFYFLYSYPFVFSIIIIYDMSWFSIRRIFNYINAVVAKNVNWLCLICCNFLTVKYHDILVIKMTFFSQKRFYKISKFSFSHNSIFSDAVKYFFILFLLKRIHIFRCFFIKCLVLFRWEKFKKKIPY